jgi:Putative peptidoglycan binding domain
MGDQVLLLVLGFLLTSVAGGALGLFFQERSWSHQHRAQQLDQRREQAIKVFEEVSSLLDRRLYRMRLVFWAAKRCAPAGRDVTALREPLEEYRKVLAPWNDNLNRTLALVQTYFGGGARQQLEDHVYEEYTAIGRALDQFVQDVSVPDHADVPVPPIGRRLTWLGHEVYKLNLVMLELLQNNQIGPAAPASGRWRRSGTPVLQFGNQGEPVLMLQRALRRAGMFDGRIDGSFGRETEEAVRAFQRSSGLPPDGVVGEATWAARVDSDGRTLEDAVGFEHAEPAPAQPR